MRRVSEGLLMLFAFAVPWEYSLDLGEPWGNVARLAGVLALLAAVPLVLLAKGLRRPGPLQWLVLGFYSYYLCSSIWSIDGEATAEKVRAYFQVMMVVWLIWEFANLPQHLLGMFRALVAGCWVLVLLTFWDFSSTSAIAAQQIRFVAEGQDPNDVARFLDLAFPIAALLFAVERNWVLRILALAYLPAGLLAVLLTASRGGFTGSMLALAGSTVMWLMWRPRAASWVLAGLAAMAVGLWVFVPSESFDRLSTIPEQVGSGDLNDRLNIWTSGWRALSRSPWFGHGAGTYAAASGLAPGDTAHNTFMAVLVTGGVLGLALFVAILLAVVWSVWQTGGLLRVAFVTSLAVWTVTAMVGSVEENRMTWLLFGLIGLAGRMALEKAEVLRCVFSGIEARRSAERVHKDTVGPISTVPAAL